MYIYTVGYGSPEDSDYAYLYHEKKLTEKQLAGISDRGLTKAEKEYALALGNPRGNFIR